MNKKLMLLALAAVSAVMFALPAVASAEVAHVSSVGKFTVSSEAGTTSSISEEESSLKLTCTSITGSGEFTTTTTGTITLSFHGCGENLFGTSCNGEAPGGQPAGTTTTTQLEFHLIELENNTPGILITANAGHFVTYTCGGGLVTRIIGGNGIVGHIATPCDGTKSTTHTIGFTQVANGTQKYTQATTTGTKYDLTAKPSAGGAAKTAALSGSIFCHFTDGVARNIICT